MTPQEQYREISELYAEKISSLKKRIAILSAGRLSLFVGVALLVYFTNFPLSYSTAIVFVGLAGFLFLIRRHVDLRDSLKEAKLVQSYAQFELDFLDHKRVSDETGEEYINSDHPFTSDLGVFGRNSLFQLINRTKTSIASARLAKHLSTNILEKEEIIRQRRMSKEFSLRPEFIFRFLAACESAEESLAEERLPTSFDNPLPKYSKPLLYLFCFGLPVVMLIITVLWILDYFDFGTYLWCLLISGLPVGIYFKKNIAGFRMYEILLKTATAYRRSLDLLRTHSPSKDSPLEEIYRNVFLDESGEAIQELKKISDAIDSRSNILIGLVLNLLLLWDFQCYRRLANWESKYGNRVNDWINLVHEMEARFSFSIYLFNHPRFVYPDFNDSDEFSIEKAKHLFLSEEGVPNDFSLKKEGRFLIITGANMAGKSTFLRMVGTNLLLAMNGLSVPAKSMQFKPTQLFTSMLTSDSLGDGESYFFSELKRLRQFTDRLEKGERLFIILDEILKGTNSVDKAEGSKLFMEKLLDLPAKGIIATHDLSLCELEDQYPGSIENFSFEVVFVDDELSFDYKLQRGVCKNMNARFLLQKMGLAKD